MVYVERFLQHTLARALRTFPAVLVTGARQTGKTTMLRRTLGATHAYVSLDRPDVRARALADPVGFLADHPRPIVLDEIQRTPELLHYVKEDIDDARKPGRWVLTGSQSLALMRGVSESLAGRVAVLTMDPFSVEELAARPFKTIERRLGVVFGDARWRPGRTRADVAEWLLRGGFPELRTHRRVERRLWLAGYVQTYLERDVRDLLRVGDIATFGRFLALVAARSGTLLGLADLARDVGTSPTTIRAWLSVLEATQLVYLLRPFHESFGKRLVKSPKLYMLDPALVTYLTGIHDAEVARRGPSAGALFESLVIAEWVKAFRQRGEVPPIFHWRSSGGDEVDLVIERDRRLYGIEIKSTATPRPEHAAGLSRWLDLAGPEARGALACTIDQPAALRPRVRAVPWWLG